MRQVALLAPSDVVGILRSATEDPDPVVIIEDRTLFDIRAEVPDDLEYRFSWAR